jgi:glycosyltransferase involved in cell wall biosynthesis
MAAPEWDVMTQGNEGTERSDAPVSLVLPSLVGGGAERTATELANHWAEQGRRVCLITIDAAATSNYPLDPRVSVRGLRLMRVSRSLVSALWNNSLRVRRLRQAIRESDARQVVSFTDVTNVTTLLACRDLQVGVIACERTEPRRHQIGSVWSRLRKRTYGRAMAIVVQTQAVKKWALAQGWGVPVYAIPNAAPRIPAEAPAVMEAPRPAVVALGRLSREKGMDLLIEAFALVAPRHPQWSLRIHGEGVEREALESQAVRLGISDRVQLAGWTRHPQRDLQAADIFALPSRYEGFPNALLEAMAAGLACVSFDCDSGPREIVRDATDGLLVPPADAPALAAALDRLMTDPDLRRRLGENAQSVVDRFSRARFHRQWDAVLSGMSVDEFERMSLADESR